jgi:hypothetical protein
MTSLKFKALNNISDQKDGAEPYFIIDVQA